MFDQNYRHALVAQSAQQLRQNLLLEAAQAGGRLVQNHHDGVGGERASDFQKALLTEREIAREFAGLFGEADALQLLESLELRRFFFAAIEPHRAGEKSRACARIRPQQRIVEQRHVRPQFHVLERACDASGGDVTRRQFRHVVIQEHDPPGVRFGGPGDQIEKRAFAGSVRSDQAQDLAGLHLEAHVVHGGERAEPFRRALNCQHGLAGHDGAGAACKRRRLRRQGRRRTRQIAVDHGNDARACLLQYDDEKDAERDNFELRAVAREYGKNVLQGVLEQRDDGRADHRARDVAGTTDQRHQQEFDAGANVERRRVHVALHMRIKPAG